MFFELAQFLMEREKKLSPAAHQFTAQRTSSLLSAQVFEFSQNKKIVKYAYAMEKKKHGNWGRLGTAIPFDLTTDKQSGRQTDGDTIDFSSAPQIDRGKTD